MSDAPTFSERLIEQCLKMAEFARKCYEHGCGNRDSETAWIDRAIQVEQGSIQCPYFRIWLTRGTVDGTYDSDFSKFVLSLLERKTT